MKEPECRCGRGERREPVEGITAGSVRRILELALERSCVCFADLKLRGCVESDSLHALIEILERLEFLEECGEAEEDRIYRPTARLREEGTNRAIARTIRQIQDESMTGLPEAA